MPGWATSGGSATRTPTSKHAGRCTFRASIRRASRALRRHREAPTRRRVARSDKRSRNASRGGVAAYTQSSL
eukprot:7270134-Alexandrium_andersonii.AAC.1